MHPALSATMLATTLVAAAPALPQTAATIVPTQSELVFVSRQMGVPVEGRFESFGAELALNPRQPEAGHVALSIDMASAKLGAIDVDEELAKPAWFDATRHPKATFQSSAIKNTGPGRFEVSGKLNIKGVTKDVVVPVALAQAGGLSTAMGTVTIKRQDFRIGDGEWNDTSLVANEVKVRFKLTFMGLDPLP